MSSQMEFFYANAGSMAAESGAESGVESGVERGRVGRNRWRRAGGGATLKPLTGETNPATMPRSAVKLPFIWMSLNTQRSTLSQIKFTANTGEDGLRPRMDAPTF